jgi:hypothetical protein
MKDYSIVTVANRKPIEPYYTFDEFFKSLPNENIFVLGTHPGEYVGLGSKPKLLYNAIKGGMLDTKYIIFCDCFDLVFATSPEHLILKHKQFAAPMVISAEKNCFPDKLKEQYDAQHKGESPYKYLNSGMIVGEVDAMLAVLEAMDAPNIPDDYWDAEKQCNIHYNDQEMYQEIFLKQPVKIILDTEQILCNTLHSVTLDEFDFSEERIANKTTSTYPCAFHFNGNSKTENGLREPILKHLNLL